MKTEWVMKSIEQCEKADVKFFFKQWGGTNKKKTGRILRNQISYSNTGVVSEQVLFYLLIKHL